MTACAKCHDKSVLIDELDYTLWDERETNSRRVASLLRQNQDLEQEACGLSRAIDCESGARIEASRREREWRLNHKQMVKKNFEQRQKTHHLYMIAWAAWNIVNEHKITQDSKSGEVVTIMLDEHISQLSNAFALAAVKTDLVFPHAEH